MIALYVSFVLLGLSLDFESTRASPLWPPAALAILYPLWRGRRGLALVWVGGFFGNLVVASYRGAPIAESLGAASVIALGHVGLGALGSWIWIAAGQADLGFRRAMSVAWWGVVSAVAPLVSSVVGVGSLYLANAIPIGRAPVVWLVWYLGDVLGALLLGPLALSWRHRKPVFWEHFGCVSLSLAVTALVWSQPRPLAFLPLIPLLIPAWRLTAWATALCVFATALVAIVATKLGHGPFAHFGAPWGVLVSQAYLAACAGIALGVSTIKTEVLDLVKERHA